MMAYQMELLNSIQYISHKVGVMWNRHNTIIFILEMNLFALYYEYDHN